MEYIGRGAKNQNDSNLKLKIYGQVGDEYVFDYRHNNSWISIAIKILPGWQTR